MGVDDKLHGRVLAILDGMLFVCRDSARAAVTATAWTVVYAPLPDICIGWRHRGFSFPAIRSRLPFLSGVREC